MPMPRFPRVRSAQTLRSFGVVATLGVFLFGQLAPKQALAAPKRTALLGLDAADSNAGRQVSDALADSLEARNALFRAPLTFAEYRLMMSCSPDNNRCLGRAGDGFDAPQILLGIMENSGSEVQVKLRLIRNRSGALLATERFVFKPENLEGDQLMTAAEYMVNSIFAEAAGKTLPAFPFAPVITKNTKPGATAEKPVKPATPAPVEAPPAPADDLANPDPAPLLTPTRPLENLSESPSKPPRRDRPRDFSGLGYKIGLGATLALAAGSFGVALWTHGRLSKDKGDIRAKILELAAQSVAGTDNDRENDIHPTRPGNLCDIARLPRESDPSKIKNQDVADVCSVGDRLVALNATSIVVGGLSLAGAAVFVGLIIRDARAKKRSRFSFNGSFNPGQGAYFSGKLRF